MVPTSARDHWDNIGGWLKARAAGRDHLHIKTHRDQVPDCQECAHG